MSLGGKYRKNRQSVPPPWWPAPSPWAIPGLKRWERVVRFCEQLVIPSGSHAGRKMVLRPWQIEIIKAAYGDNCEHDVRTVIVSVARKNGKSALAAALVLCHLSGPESEINNEIYSAAADKNQAAIIFRAICGILNHPDMAWLACRMNIKRFTKEVEDLENGSLYAALSSEVGSKHGLSAGFFVADETAQWDGQELYDVLKTSQGARAHPLRLVISTQAGDDDHWFSNLLDFAQEVEDGLIDDPTTRCFLWTVPDKDENGEETPYDDESTWHLANPALDDFRSLKDMRSEARQCQHMPANIAAFRNLFLNQRIDVQGAQWIDWPIWSACRRDYTEDSLAGCKCTLALDLSSVRDLTACVAYFETGETLCWAWLPAATIKERSKEDKIPYTEWARRGLIKATPGRSVDKAIVAKDLGAICKKFDVQGILFDRYGMPELEKYIEKLPEKLPERIEHGQGYKDMSPSAKACEAAILAGTLYHNGNPVLGWCVRNVRMVIDDADNVKPTKKRAIGRIDAAICLIMSAGYCLRTKPKSKRRPKITVIGA